MPNKSKTRSGRLTTSTLARNNSPDASTESGSASGGGASSAKARGRPVKKRTKNTTGSDRTPSNESRESVQDTATSESIIMADKIDAYLSKMKQELLHELRGEQGRSRSLASRSEKRKSKPRDDSDGTTTDSDSQSHSPVRASSRKKPKKSSQGGKKSKPSPIPVVSASEDEDWGRSRNKFGYLVGKNLSEKLREKIKTDQYVEMADLLPSSQDKKDDLVMKKSEEGVRFVESKPHRFVDIDKWNQAFRVYTSIYVETAAPLGGNAAVLLMKQLLTYQNNINQFARRRESWFLYDKHFRKERAASSDPDLFSDIRHDILLDLDMSGRKERYNPDHSSSRKRNFRGFDKYGSSGFDNRRKGSGFCFLFNDEQKHCNRSRCLYKHNCIQCGGGHPKFMCERANAAASNLERLQAQASKQPAPKSGNQNQRTG